MESDEVMQNLRKFLHIFIGSNNETGKFGSSGETVVAHPDFDDTFLDKLLDLLKEAADKYGPQNQKNGEYETALSLWVKDPAIVGQVFIRVKSAFSEDKTSAQHSEIPEICFCIRLFGLLPIDTYSDEELRALATALTDADDYSNENLWNNEELSVATNELLIKNNKSVWNKEPRVREATFIATNELLTKNDKSDGLSHSLLTFTQAAALVAVSRLAKGNSETYLVQKAAKIFLIAHLRHAAVNRTMRETVIRCIFHVLKTHSNCEAVVGEVSEVLFQVAKNDSLEAQSNQTHAEKLSENFLTIQDFCKALKNIATSSQIMSESFWELIFLYFMTASPQCPPWVRTKHGQLLIARNHIKFSAGVMTDTMFLEDRLKSLDFLLMEATHSKSKELRGKALRYLSELPNFMAPTLHSKVLHTMLDSCRSSGNFQFTQFTRCVQAFLECSKGQKECSSEFGNILEFIIRNKLVMKFPGLTQKLLEENQSKRDSENAGESILFHKDVLSQVEEALNSREWEERDSSLQIIDWFIDQRDSLTEDQITHLKRLVQTIFDKHSIKDSSHFVRAGAVAILCKLGSGKTSRMSKSNMAMPPDIKGETLYQLILSVISNDPDPVPRRSAISGLIRIFRGENNLANASPSSVELTQLKQILAVAVNDIDLEVKMGAVSALKLLACVEELQDCVTEQLILVLGDSEAQIAAFDAISELKKAMGAEYRAKLEQLENCSKLGFVKENLKSKKLDVRAERLLDDILASCVRNPEVQTDCY